MEWSLKRVLFWWSVLAAVFVGFTLINYIWPLNPSQPQERIIIGALLNLKELLFATLAYVLLKAQRIKACVVTILVWLTVKVAYGIALLVFEPFSGHIIVIVLGQLLMVSLLGYFLAKETSRVREGSNAT
jgi:hypothetical protein